MGPYDDLTLIFKMLPISLMLYEKLFYFIHVSRNFRTVHNQFAQLMK